MALTTEGGVMSGSTVSVAGAVSVRPLEFVARQM